MTANEFELPTLVANWTSVLFYLLYALLAVWLFVKAIAYWQRKNYNLTKAETSAQRNTKPDFLTIDHVARAKQLDPTAAASHPQTSKALTITGIALVITALASCVSAIITAFLRIESLEQAWREISSWDRLQAIIAAYPVGFTAATIIGIGALIRLFFELRASKISSGQ